MSQDKVIDGVLCRWHKGSWVEYTSQELTELYTSLKNDVLYQVETLSTLLEELKK